MMKNYKYLLLGLLSLPLVACASNNADYLEFKGGEVGGEGYAADMGEHTHAPKEGVGSGAAAIEGDGGEPVEGDESEEKNVSQIPAGQLTCSALNDNLYYEFWKNLTGKNQEEGQFYKYRSEIKDSFNTYNRVKLKITNGNDIYVTLKGENKKFHVDNFQNAYLFPKTVEESYEITISYLDKNGNRVETTKEVKDNDEIDLENEFTTPNNLEIMFVIDATGSMGDEMDYIKAEIDNVVGKVKEDNPTSKVSLAMMVYRDEGDDYVTRYSNFTEKVATQQTFLKKQQASGGGDFEEAVNVALKEAVNKQWSSKGTKLLFHVADAPSHDKDIADWSNTAYKAAEKGIQIITVAASGIDKKTEYLFRSQSLLTGGQYVYLTDDSGIGNSHEKPTIEETLPVEFLNDCLIRLIDSYHQGKDISPVPYTQVVKQ